MKFLSAAVMIAHSHMRVNITAGCCRYQVMEPACVEEPTDITHLTMLWFPEAQYKRHLQVTKAKNVVFWSEEGDAIWFWKKHDLCIPRPPPSLIKSQS